MFKVNPVIYILYNTLEADKSYLSTERLLGESVFQGHYYS